MKFDEKSMFPRSEGVEDDKMQQEAARRLDSFLKATAPKHIDRKAAVSWKKKSMKFGSRAVMIVESFSLAMWLGAIFFCLYHMTGGELCKYIFIEISPGPIFRTISKVINVFIRLI